MAKRILLASQSEPASSLLIGISTQLKDYRLSFLLNRDLDFNLAKYDDISIVPDGKKEPASFSISYYLDEDRFNSYFLVSNRSQEQFLISRYRQADFILFVEGKLKKQAKNDLLSGIRKIPNVLTAFEIPSAEVKNLDQILTDLELNFPIP